MPRPSSPRKPAAPRPPSGRGSRSRPSGRTRSGAAAGERPSAGTGRARTASTSSSTPGKAGGARGSRRLTIETPDGNRPLLSLRALALVLTLLVAFAIVAPTARHALVQAEELRSAEDALERAHETEQRLADELALWEDPEYVQAQARDRLGYIMPGETPFVVVDPESVTGGLSEAEAEEAEREEALAASRPWYLNLQESVEEAGRVPTEGTATGEAPVDEVPEPELPPETPSEAPSGELPTSEPLAD